MKQSLLTQILANYLGTVVGILAPIVALPWYLKALGAEQWGLMGFAATLIAVLSLLDHGIHQTLLREFGQRLGGTGRESDLPALLYGFESIYWIFSAVAATLVWLSAGAIATHWMNPGGLDPSVCRQAVAGAAILFAAQLPGMLYGSVLLGTGNQLLYNAILVSANLLRHAAGIFIVLIWPTVTALLSWYIIVAAGETAARRVLAWRMAGSQRHHTKWDVALMRRISVSTVGMSGAVLIGALTTQIDRILLSGLAPVAMFGYYTVASNIALALLNLIYPIMTAALPKMAALQLQPDHLREFNRRLFLAVFAIVSATGVFLYLTGPMLLDFWLRDAAYAANVWVPLSVLLVGTGLNALYNIGYNNWIAGGKIRPVFLVNTLSLVVAATTIPWLVGRYGISGAAIGWVAMNAIGLAISLPQLTLNRGLRIA